VLFYRQYLVVKGILPVLMDRISDEISVLEK